jgi:RNA polymerase sigma-70 factor (ECF subfamily)
VTPSASTPAERADEPDRPIDLATDWTPPSWDEVVRTHSARVYRLAYRLTGNPTTPKT